ncbi:hypothetical protein K438DRAFT_1942237 [Mycena galopus ATCC 62051]|nr:hypothetical protein K438DRAFT_1942237 [Mycena galopus ATCC 62051]
MMSALHTADTVRLDPNGSKLWPYLLSAERVALATGPRNNGAKYLQYDNLIGVRVLGLDFWQNQSHSFGLVPYHRLSQEIWSCLSLSIPGTIIGSQAEALLRNAKLYELGLFYRNHLMRVFQSNGGPLPTVSQHPSRPSLELVKQQIIEDVQTPTTTPDARGHVRAVWSRRVGYLLSSRRSSAAATVTWASVWVIPGVREEEILGLNFLTRKYRGV